jgi:hypothetical protein
MNWRGCGRKRPKLNLKYYPSIFLKTVEKPPKTAGSIAVSGPRFDTDTS